MAAESGNSPLKVYECSVCLQTCVHPVRLTVCGHIFCFLCIKGAAMHSLRCPMCRAAIPAQYFDNPEVLSSRTSTDFEANAPTIVSSDTTNSDSTRNTDKPSSSKDAADVSITVCTTSKDSHTDSTHIATEAERSDNAGECEWFYEGRSGGWWQYDERTAADLEKSYHDVGLKPHLVELLIAGHMYVVDFEQMIQYQKNRPNKRRRVKRDSKQSLLVKGIAGLKL